MIVVDSSAIVAVMIGEATETALVRRLHQTPRGQRYLSAANYVEAGAVMAGRHADPAAGIAGLKQFLDISSITIFPIDAELAEMALEARIVFGRGFGAAAGLNFGDCFAYALAKKLNAPLLYVGDDFSRTDIQSALD